MADKDTASTEQQKPVDKYAPQRGDIETQVGGVGGLTIEMGEDKPVLTREGSEGLIHDTDTGGIREDDKGLDLTDEEKAALGDDTGEKPPEGEKEKPEGEEGAPEVLPEFDPTKPEVVKAYDARYLSEDGKAFNEDALGKEWVANTKDGNPETGHLSESTYKWFETKGIPRAAVKQHEAGVLALQKVKAAEIITQAGGAEQYQAAVAWAREGGYPKDAAAKFNAAINGNDVAARKDAVDLLMSRFQKANPGRRAQGPKRTTGSAGNPPGGSQGGGAAQGYESQQEYQTAFRAAINANNGRGDQKALDETRRRLRASKWYGGNKK
jgi:hypothetical protein